jgi:hypothetical protein
VNITIRKFIEITFLGFLLVTCSMPKERVSQFVLAELKNYPEARLSDIYKNFFQDSYGPGHLIPDTLEAGRYLDSELQDPLWGDTIKFQELGIHHDFIRINLMLVKNGVIPRSVFLDAMVRSVPTARKPGMETWKKEWLEVVKIVKEIKPDLPGYSQDSLKIDEMLAKGEVVIHHSERFTEKYHPHYRIIHKSFLESWKDSYLKEK